MLFECRGKYKEGDREGKSGDRDAKRMSDLHEPKNVLPLPICLSLCLCVYSVKCLLVVTVVVGNMAVQDGGKFSSLPPSPGIYFSFPSPHLWPI